MLAALVRLVAYGDDRIPGLRLHAARIAIGHGEVYVIVAYGQYPAPIILVAHVMGDTGFHVELTALRQVVNGELVDDLPLPVRLFEVTTIGHLTTSYRGQYLLAGGIEYLCPGTVIYGLVLG